MLMTTQTTETGRRDERLDEVVQLIRAKVPAEAADELAAFVRQYFGQVDPEDLAERQVADLYGAALSHWSFARKREPGRAQACACSTRRSRSTAGSRRTPSSRSSTTTCRSWSIR